MRRLAILAIFIAIKVYGEPTDEALLSSERIAEHKDAFQVFETILADAGFRKARYEEIDDPTLHFASFIEWAYFIQPVFGASKNELLIGFDKDGKLGMFGRESLAPMCDCPGDHLYPIKREEMEEAVKKIWETQDSAIKTAQPTAANSRLFDFEPSQAHVYVKAKPEAALSGLDDTQKHE